MKYAIVSALSITNALSLTAYRESKDGSVKTCQKDSDCVEEEYCSPNVGYCRYSLSSPMGGICQVM